MANSVDQGILSASATGSDAWPEQAAPLSEAQLLAQATEPAAKADPVPVDAGSGQPIQAAQPNAAPAAPATSAEYTADASNVVHLPANISVDNIKVDGKNLILEQADGTEIVVKDAASNVPTFMLGDVELPRVALIAALEAGGVDVAFGPDGSISVGPGSANSSGGNFEAPIGGIGNGFDLSALLPPTALQFPQYEYRELYAGLEERDTEPTIDVGTGFFVDEEALSDGSNPGSDAEQASGSFNISSGNDIGSLVINGVDVTNGGQVTGTYGTLTVTGDPQSGYGWTYVLNDNTLDHLDKTSTGTAEGIFDSFNVVVTDTDGDPASATLNIDVLDDGPTLSVQANTETSGGLVIELDESVGPDRYNTGEVESGTNTNTDDAAPALAQNATALVGGLASLFSVGGVYGADGAGQTVGSFSFTGIPDAGLATNLSATDGGAITLFLEGGEIIGRDTQNNMVLKIAIVGAPGSEQLQTTLYEALDHGQDSNQFDSSQILALTQGNTIELQYEVTRTDGDGDSITKTATVPLADSQGSGFVFDDDGPSLTVAANEGAAAQLAVELDETVGADRYNTGEVESGTNTNTDDAVGVLAQVSSNVTGGLTQLFTIGGDFGSDGPGKVTSTLSFTGIPDAGLATNLSATNGGAITLFLEGGEIIGRDTDNNMVLKIAIVGAPGSEQLQTTLYEALDHGQDSNQFDSSQILALTQGNKIELQYEVTRTDGDGDSITQTATVPLADSQGSGFVFDDDGPKLVGKAQFVATVDEDALGNAQSSGNTDSGKTGEVTGTNLAVATGNAGALLALVDFGQDGPHPTTAFGLATQTTPVDTGFSSRGDDVLIVSDGATLTGYVNVGGGAGFDAGTDRPVFTLTVAGDGSYVFTLIDQIDHPTLNGQQGDDTENLLTGDGIDLSSFVVAMDGDGDTIGLGAGSFQVQVLDDIPTIVARDAGSTTTTTTETIVYTLQAGNTDVRGMDGTGNHDIKLTGIDVNEGDNSVNTTGTKIGIGDGQIIDGYETHPKTSGPEILTMDFVNNLSITPNNPNPPIVTDGGSYDVSSVTFTIDVAEAQGIESAVLFIGAKDGGAFEAVTVKINGVSVVGTPVFEGGVQVGYAFASVPDGATVEVTGNTPFDQLRVGNYNGFTFDSTAGGTDTTLSGGNPFKIYGIEAKVTTTTTVTEVFRVSHDESAGVNTGSDPNPANDVDPLVNVPPALIQDPSAIGYAKSVASVLTLFNDVSVGADETGVMAFSVTDANGNAIANVDSGLKTLGGAAIMLSTDSNGVLVGKAGSDTVFKVYVDGTGSVWIAQYQPIAHGLDGTSSAAMDDIATIAANLHVKATITDFDGDTTTAVSKVALVVDFQDDGPVAHDDQNSVTEDGPLSASGNVVTDAPGADATGTDGYGSIAWDGAAGTVVAGTYGQLTVGVDGSYTYTLYTQVQNPAAYAAVQGLSNNETLSESFDYTLTDGDGDSSPATLTITINGADDGVTIGGLTPSADGGDAVVDEKGLPPRSGEPAGSGEVSPNPNDNSDTSETTTGDFNFTSPDGLQSLTIAGSVISYAQLAASGSTPITIVGGPAYGTLVINGFTGTQAGGTVQYRFTLTDNLATHADTDPTGDGDSDRGAADQLFANYTLSVTDADGSSAPGTLSIAINDDGPTANNDVATQGAENQAFTINAFANDVFGADGVDIDNNPAVAVTFTQPTQGVVTYDPATGLFTYTPNAGAGSSSTADSFTYTIKDGDGDVSTATVSLTLAADSTPTVTVTDGTVDEKGLANGSGEVADPAANTDNSETTTGTFTVATGSDGLAKLEIQDKDGVWQNVTGGGTVQGANGVLTVTNNAGTYSWSYTLANNLLSHDDNALSGVDGDSDRGAADQKPGDNFQVRVEDSDGDVSAPDTLTITVNDDGPTANNDTWASTITGATVLTGLFANDVFGADGVDTDNSPVAGQVTVTQPAHGTVTYNNNGTFTYTPTVPYVGSDSFTYTIKDGDGDVSTATVSLNVQTNTVPSGGGTVSLTLNESALDTTLDAAPTPADLHAGTVTGTTPGSRGETAQAASGITFTSTGEAIAVAFANPVGDPSWVAPTVSGLAAGYSISWALVGNELVGTLMQGATNLGPAIYLSLSNTSAGANSSLTPVVTATLTDQLQHLVGSGNITVTGLKVVATDTSGDEASGNVNLTVLDDAPLPFKPDTIFVENTTHTVLTEQINFAPRAGADGVGDVVFNVVNDAAVKDTAGTNIFMNGEQVFYRVVDTHTVEGRTSVANGSDLAFTATLNPATGTWTYTQHATMFAGNQFNTALFTPSGGNNQAIVLDSTGSTSDLLATANSPNFVNTSTGSWGVDGGNSITGGEKIRFDFVSSAATNGTIAGTSYADHYEVASYTQGIGNVSGPGLVSITIRPVNADNDSSYIGDAAGETTAFGTLVTVVNGSGGAAPTATYNPADGTWTITGLAQGDTFTVIANADPFSAIEIGGNAGTNDFKLGPVTYTTANAVTPFDISIPVTATDGDGDTVAGSVTAKLSPDASTWQGTAGDDTHTTTATETTLLGEDGNDTLNGLNGVADLLSGGRGDDTLTGNSGNDILFGGSGADSLFGGADNDILVGGSGLDQLSGGTGADTFKLESLDMADIIADYSGAEGDKIDLTALFDSAPATVGDYVNYDAGTGKLSVDVDGTANGANFVDVATLSNTPAAITVTLLFDDGTTTHQIQANVV